MRHKVSGYKLNRDKDSRKTLRRSLIINLYKNNRISTTKAKAKAIRGEAEKMITVAKRSAKGSETDVVNARRYVSAALANDDAVRLLFDDIAPRFESRNGGYTRMFKLGPRIGDSAEMVILELLEE
jgi:large subunit ribosomal protein L17